MGAVEGTAKRNAAKNTFARDGMPRAVEELPERLGVGIRQGRVVGACPLDDGGDIVGCAARVGDELCGGLGYFAGGHDFVAGADDVLFLGLGERVFLEDLVVPQKIGVKGRATVGGHARDDTIVVLGVALGLLQSLLASGGAAVEVSIRGRLAVVRLDDLFGMNCHEVGGAESKILPDLPVTDSRI